MSGVRSDVQIDSALGARHWLAAVSIGAVFSAIAASICCIGPIALALLGLGGAGLLSRFAPYSGALSLLPLALLASAFYRIYRRPAAALSGDAAQCACVAPRTPRTGKIMLWVSTLLVIAILSFPYLAPYLIA